MAGDWTDIRKPSEDTRVSVRSGGIEIRRKGKPVRGAVSGTDGVVYLAIDYSASVEGAKLIQAKQGALDFFNEVRTKGYSVGLIRFETNARIVCDPQRELASLSRYVNELESRGVHKHGRRHPARFQQARCASGAAGHCRGDGRPAKQPGGGSGCSAGGQERRHRHCHNRH